MNTPIDIYLETPSAKACLDDLLAIGLVSLGPDLSIVKAPGVSVDYIGPMVATPATYDYTAFPPKEVTPAVWYAGERVNIRLTGDAAEDFAAKIKAATLANTAVLSEPPTTPQRVWA